MNLFFHIFLLPGTKESMSMKATNGRDDWCFDSCLHVCVRVWYASDLYSSALYVKWLRFQKTSEKGEHLSLPASAFPSLWYSIADLMADFSVSTGKWARTALGYEKKILPHTSTYTAYDWNKDLLKMMNKLWQINLSHFIYAQCSMAEILLTLWNWAVVLFCVHSFCVSDHFYLRNTMIGSCWLSFYLTSFQFLWQRFTPFDMCAPNWTWAFWHCSRIYGYLHFWIIFIPTNNS